MFFTKCSWRRELLPLPQRLLNYYSCDLSTHENNESVNLKNLHMAVHNVYENSLDEFDIGL